MLRTSPIRYPSQTRIPGFCIFAYISTLSLKPAFGIPLQILVNSKFDQNSDLLSLQIRKFVIFRPIFFGEIVNSVFS